MVLQWCPSGKLAVAEDPAVAPMVAEDPTVDSVAVVVGDRSECTSVLEGPKTVSLITDDLNPWMGTAEQEEDIKDLHSGIIQRTC